MSIETSNLPVLILRFEDGYKHFNDLVALVGLQRAEVCAQRCVDLASTFCHNVLLEASKIAHSAYINPESLPQVEFFVTGLCVETLKVMYESQCTNAGSKTPWEFVGIIPGRLQIRPGNELVAQHHPWLLTTTQPRL